MLNEDSNARDELKRADHLIYVTLKYTKTCDVIKNIIRRLINAFDKGIVQALESLKNKGRVSVIPPSPISRAELLKSMTKRKPEVLEFLSLYFTLKFIDKAEYTKKEEYRKHVTLIVIQEEEIINVDVPKLHEFYKKTKEFVDYVEKNYK